MTESEGRRMTIKSAINALKEKQKIIYRTDNDHWLYEPISVVLDELEATRKALEMVCKEICYSEENFDNGYLTKDYVELFLQKAREV